MHRSRKQLEQPMTVVARGDEEASGVGLPHSFGSRKISIRLAVASAFVPPDAAAVVPLARSIPVLSGRCRE
jgi:hypothetical protein